MLFAALPASASSIIMEFDVLTAGTAASGNPSIILDDEAGPDQIRVTVDTTALLATDVLSAIHLNYAGPFPPSPSLGLTNVSGPAAAIVPNIGDGFWSGGNAGDFDIRLSFANFGGGQISVFTFDQMGIALSDFLVQSTNGYYAAANLNGLGAQMSSAGWQAVDDFGVGAVPEPSAGLCYAVGLVVVGSALRRRKTA